MTHKEGCLFPNRDFNLASTAAQKTPAPEVLGRPSEAAQPSVDGAVEP